MDLQPKVTYLDYSSIFSRVLIVRINKPLESVRSIGEDQPRYSNAIRKLTNLNRGHILTAVQRKTYFRPTSTFRRLNVSSRSSKFINALLFYLL